MHEGGGLVVESSPVDVSKERAKVVSVSLLDRIPANPQPLPSVRVILLMAQASKAAHLGLHRLRPSPWLLGVVVPNRAHGQVHGEEWRWQWCDDRGCRIA